MGAVGIEYGRREAAGRPRGCPPLAPGFPRGRARGSSLEGSKFPNEGSKFSDFPVSATAWRQQSTAHLSITRRAVFHPGRHHFARLTSGKLCYVPTRPSHERICTQKHTARQWAPSKIDLERPQWRALTLLWPRGNSLIKFRARVRFLTAAIKIFHLNASQRTLFRR